MDAFQTVEDMGMFPSAETHPILFEEIYIKELEDEAKMKITMEEIEKTFQITEYKGVHLIVLCHGFQGNSYDMRLFKNNISIVYPETLFLCSTSNEDTTDGEISEMGLRLAGEVMNYIQDWIPMNNLGRYTL